MIRPEKLSDRRVVMVDMAITSVRNRTDPEFAPLILMDTSGEMYACAYSAKFCGTAYKNRLVKLIAKTPLDHGWLWSIREL